MKRNTLLAALVIVAAFGSTLAQAKAPEEVVHEYVTALQTEGLTATTRFIHPDDLVRFKQMFMPLLRSDKKIGDKSFREFLFEGEVTLEQIEKMTGDDFMTAFMKRIGGMIPDFKLGPMKVIGTVPEGEIVHALARGSAEVQDIKVTQLEIITLKPYQGGWKLLLNPKMEGLAAAFEKAAK